MAELATSQEDLQRKIHNIVLDTRTQPEKDSRLWILFFSRTDKGFGIKDQAVTFRTLSDVILFYTSNVLLVHIVEKILCSQCRGKGFRLVRFVGADGNQPVINVVAWGVCKTPPGLASCDECRATVRFLVRDGGAAMGQIKCRSGLIPMPETPRNGWMSHLAHVEIRDKSSFL